MDKEIVRVEAHGLIPTEYQVVNGTFYSMKTPDEVIAVLESARQFNKRIRLFYGDINTGKDWCEECETVGRIGRTTGIVKIPILLKQANSSGGGGILDDCIVRITETVRGQKVELYRHPSYTLGYMCIKPVLDEELIKQGLGYEVHLNDRVQARFATNQQAQRYYDFLEGKRNKI